MAITEQQESAALAARAARRQDKTNPWLIRDDGTIFPNVPLLARRKNMRPYRGDISAPLEQRMRYLQGLPSQRKIVIDAEPETFNITKATKEELIAFAFEDYSEVIDAEEHINKVRSIVCSLAGLEYNEVFGGGPTGSRQRKVVTGEGAGLAAPGA